MTTQTATTNRVGKETTKTREGSLPYAWIVVLHLLPGALTMLFMLLATFLLKELRIPPSVPVLFVFVAPVLILMQLGFLLYKGWQLNGKLSLRGIVLYRDDTSPWWKLVALALPMLAWSAFVWFAVKTPVNNFFIEHVFAWMPVNFLDEYFLDNLNQYSPAYLRVIGVLFALSITIGGAVEELYFRGYLLPRMESLGVWAPITNVVLFSLSHFWSPWENAVRLFALTPWIFAVWRTRDLYLSLLIHFTINAFAGISLLSLILRLT
ncbi:MAG TPA: CPBP family intramembrane glutamic endopeptidase [Anaerolineales bacterium]|nr:CPBP family intramembrane glutamic endopeptidase [Anaerolineales bacterium]